MSQQLFLEELLTSHNLLNAKPQDILLHDKRLDDMQVPNNTLRGIHADNLQCAYQSIVGSLLYLAAWTRPDIAYSVVALAQWNKAPTRSTMMAAKGVLCYLFFFSFFFGGTCSRGAILQARRDWTSLGKGHFKGNAFTHTVDGCSMGLRAGYDLIIHGHIHQVFVIYVGCVVYWLALYPLKPRFPFV